MDALINAALVNIHDDQISVHRLVQTAFTHYLGHEKLQAVFSRTTMLLFAIFPKRDFKQFLVSKWPECERVILRVIALAEDFSWLSSVQTLVPWSSWSSSAPKHAIRMKRFSLDEIIECLISRVKSVQRSKHCC